MKRDFFVGEYFESLGGFERRDQMNGRPEDAHGVASFFQAGGALTFEQTGEASRDARANGHGDAVAANSGGVNPGTVGFDGEIVEEEAGFEIVGAIEEKIEAGEKSFGVLGRKVGDDAFDENRGVDGVKFLLRRDGFGERIASIGFVEKGLALKVGSLYEIAVEDAETADTRAGKKRSGSGANSPTADDDGACGSEALLAGFADTREENLARVSFESGVFGRRVQGVKRPHKHNESTYL